jgi:hypothetical protein
MKSLLVDTGRCLYKVYNYHDSRAYGYKWSRILPRIEGIGLGVEWSGFWLSCVIYRILLWIMLCDILLIQLNLGRLAYNFNLESSC